MKEELERLLEEDTFVIGVPNVCSLVKSTTSDREGDSDRKIGGWCSTEDMDRQDESVVARGLDFNEFIHFGWFNDNHKQGTAEQLGWPTLAKLVKSRWYTEGYLISDYAPADKVYELAKALKSSGAPRSLGFSIEGKVLERNGKNRIVRAKVRNVAITANPVNTNCTWSLLAKAMASADEVEDGLRKSLSVAGNSVLRPESLEILRHRRNKKLTRAEAVEELQRKRPSFSKAHVERIVDLAIARNS